MSLVIKIAAVTTVVVALIVSVASPAAAQTVGSAQSFAIVGGTTVTAGGAVSTITGDVGVSPGSSITGFPAPASTVPPYGVHANDGQAISAQAATLSLYNNLAGTGGATAILPALGGTTRNPGVFSTGAADIAGGTSLTLDGAGTYIFQVASTLTSNVGSSVVLINGANACNVYWQVTTAATLNGTTFAGNVVAQTNVTLGTGDALTGRALATSLGSITLSGGNTISGCSIPTAAPVPTPVPLLTDLYITKSHAGTFVVGTAAAYTIVTHNGGSTPSSGLITVTDVLPAGLTYVSATGAGSWTCGAVGQTVTCTTPASVQLGSLGSNITITVMPTAAAVPSVTNTASVSGGGDSDNSNNSTSDITAVALSVPTLPQSMFILLSLLIAACGVVALRRRSQV